MSDSAMSDVMVEWLEGELRGRGMPVMRGFGGVLEWLDGQYMLACSCHVYGGVVRCRCDAYVSGYRYRYAYQTGTSVEFDLSGPGLCDEVLDFVVKFVEFMAGGCREWLGDTKVIASSTVRVG